MRRYTLQDDYGGFDTRFIGITLRMWPKAWELHNHFMAADRDPGQVLQIGNKALRGSTEEAFEIFSIGTVLIHEMRHFHDFMLSPYGNHILRLRVLAAVNGLPLIAHMGSTVKEIPVPITKWGQLSEADKLIFSGEWQRLLGKDINIKLAVDKIAFAEVEKAYDKIKDFVIAPPVSTQIPYHPHHIFEASAIAVQINNVFNVFGIPHADLFANYLLSSDVTRQYTLALRAWQALTDATGDLLDIRLLSAAVVWSILGNYETTGWSACPTVRFAKLVVFLSQEGLPDGNTSIPQLFDYWSQRLDTSSSVKKAIEIQRLETKNCLIV